MANKKETLFNQRAYTPPEGITSNQKKLNEEHTQKMRDLMNKNGVSRRLLQWADSNDVKIHSDHKCTALLYSFTKENAICLDSRIPPTALVDLLTSELERYKENHEEPINDGISQTSYFWKMNADIISERHTHGQKKDDKKRIEQICRLMKKSPLGKEMLKWADKHDVKIYLDHQCEKAIGYYFPGSNSVCLNSRYKNNSLIEVLAHELRHCWQDHNGLISGHQTSPQEYATHTRFIEADAFAFGRCVAYEVSLKMGKQNIDNTYYNCVAKYTLKREPNALKNGTLLSQFFDLFFSNSNPRHSYDAHSLKTIAGHLKIINFKIPSVTGEFTNIGIVSKHAKKLNPYDEKNVRKLGDIFGQYNYLNHLKEPLSKDEKYIGNFSKEHKTLFKQIKHHKKTHRNKA